MSCETLSRNPEESINGSRSRSYSPESTRESTISPNQRRPTSKAFEDENDPLKSEDASMNHAKDSQMFVKIKQEPEDKDYLDSDCTSCGSDPTRPDPSTSRESEGLESAMAPRYHRARYFRRNYASPECAVCEVCQAEFGGPDLLRLHKLAHFNTASVCYVCDSLICDTNGQPLGSKLTLHMASHHKAICTPSGNYKPEAERAFVCPICLQRFSSNKILTLHSLKQHNQTELTNFACKICSMDFISGRALHTHLLGNRHKDMKIKVQSIFMCIDCRAIFPARDSYAMHMMMRAQSESCTPLEDCVKAITREQVLINKMSPVHEKEHIERKPLHEEKASTSHINGETLKSNDSCLSPKESLKYEKGEFICDTCNLRFYHPDTLQMHKKMMHISEKVSNGDDNKLSLFDAIQARSLIAQSTGMSWSCVACGFDFESCDSLAMHVMDQHSGDVTLPVAATSNPEKKPSFVSPALTHMSYKPSARKVFGESIPIAANSQDLVQTALARIAPLVNLSTQSLLQQRSSARSPSLYENATQLRLKRISLDSLMVNNDLPEKKPRACYLCKECKSDFNTKTELDHHSLTCGSFYSKCSFCHVSFHDKDILLQHLKHCNPNPLCNCRSCGQEFRSMMSIGEHFLKCPKTGSKNDIVCAKCKCALENEGDMISHFEQDMCCSASQDSEVTSSKQENNNAKYVQHEKQVYLCKQCAWSSNNANDYIKHMVQNHPISQNERTKADTPPPDPSDRHDDLKKKSGRNEVISSLVQDAASSKRNKRKLKPGMRIISSAENIDWKSVDSETTEMQHDASSNKHEPQDTNHGLIAIPVSPGVLSDHSGNTDSSNIDKQLDATGHEHMQGQELLSYVLSNAQGLIMCKYCNIIYTDRTMYYLHMGLHNLNNPWQCNLCGKVCANVHEFSSHVIHYR